LKGLLTKYHVPLQEGPRPSACIGVHTPRYAESPAVPVISDYRPTINDTDTDN
jgi:hypothetical protein